MFQLFQIPSYVGCTSYMASTKSASCIGYQSILFHVSIITKQIMFIGVPLLCAAYLLYLNSYSKMLSLYEVDILNMCTFVSCMTMRCVKMHSLPSPTKTWYIVLLYSIHYTATLPLSVSVGVMVAFSDPSTTRNGEIVVYSLNTMAQLIHRKTKYKKVCIVQLEISRIYGQCPYIRTLSVYTDNGRIYG